MAAVIHSSQYLNPSASLRLNSTNAQQPIYFTSSSSSLSFRGSNRSRISSSRRMALVSPKAKYIREDYLVKKVSAKEVEELVKGERNVPLVVDFYATWCGPCILMAQELETLNPQLSFQIKLHAFLLWASVGLLMPVGILVIRMSQRVQCGQKLKILYYSHVILQIVSVLLATSGAVLSIKNFENSFSNTHQRIGLVLYALIWIQPLIGFCRPNRGVKVRSLWYFVHWLLGSGITVAGVINIYIGLHAYHAKTSRSVKLWTILFTAEVAAIAFIYLFQDRWDYMKKQGVILGEEQITPTDHATPPRINKNQKELGVLLQMVES